MDRPSRYLVVSSWSINTDDHARSEDHFQLQTLYCNNHDDDNDLDLSRIIVNQTKLQILGICSNDNDFNLVETLKVLHNTHSPLPIIFAVGTSDSDSHHEYISIFPTFYSVDRWATMPQLLVESFNKDQGSEMRIEMDRASQLSIYLIDFSDIAAIRGLAKDMATNFSQIFVLLFAFKRPCEIVVSFLYQLPLAPWIWRIFYILAITGNKRSHLFLPQCDWLELCSLAQGW